MFHLVPVDRLEYLMKYIVKNEFIKRAKMLETDFVPKWKYDDLKKSVTNAYSSNRPPSEIKVIIDGHRYNVI